MSRLVMKQFKEGREACPQASVRLHSLAEGWVSPPYHRSSITNHEIEKRYAAESNPL